MKTLRPYQQRSSDYLAANKRALCVCPAGGGKTIIAASALSKAKREGGRIGWACNTREQVDQGAAAMAAFGVGPAWVKCVAGIKPLDMEGLDFLVLDECQHLVAPSWMKVALAGKGAIWGLTATPESQNAERDKVFSDFWQGNVTEVMLEEVKAGGHLAKGVIRVVDVDREGEFDAEIERKTNVKIFKTFKNFKSHKLSISRVMALGDAMSQFALDVLDSIQKMYPKRYEVTASKAKWSFTLPVILANANRENAAVELANESIAEGKSVLVLVLQIEQGKALEAKIPGSLFVSAKTPKKARKAAIDDFRDGSLNCMIATSLADEGMDVPRASVLILATVGRSLIKVIQRAGRVMRPFEGKEFGVVYDFADKGASMAKFQHFARMKIYRSLGYLVERV